MKTSIFNLKWFRVSNKSQIKAFRNLIISKLEFFVAITDDFQQLNILVKISMEFLNLYMATKNDY